MTFTMPLKETTVTEEEAVTMECQLSKPDRKVTWYKDGKEITPDDRVEITVEGTFHRLTIKKSYVEDEAEYTVKIKDQSTTAMLWVEGQSSPIWNFFSVRQSMY